MLTFPLPFGDSSSIPSDGRKKRQLETKSMAIGPSFMMQFLLVIGCQEPVLHVEEDDQPVLENAVRKSLILQ